MRAIITSIVNKMNDVESAISIKLLGTVGKQLVESAQRAVETKDKYKDLDIQEENFMKTVSEWNKTITDSFQQLSVRKKAAEDKLKIQFDPNPLVRKTLDNILKVINSSGTSYSPKAKLLISDLETIRFLYTNTTNIGNIDQLPVLAVQMPTKPGVSIVTATTQSNGNPVQVATRASRTTPSPASRALALSRQAAELQRLQARFPPSDDGLR